MMVMSIALLTAGRWMLNVATPSETVKDNELTRTPSQSFAEAGTSIMPPGRHSRNRSAASTRAARPAAAPDDPASAAAAAVWWPAPEALPQTGMRFRRPPDSLPVLEGACQTGVRIRRPAGYRPAEDPPLVRHCRY